VAKYIFGLIACQLDRSPVQQANSTLNVSFLRVVAAWRVALLCFYLRRLALLQPALVAVGAAVPISLVVSTLTFLNLHRVVFDIMGGLREPNAHERAYLVLLVITILSFYGAIPLLFCYIAAVLSPWRRLGEGAPQAAVAAGADEHARGGGSV
jgi:hypothetical protein